MFKKISQVITASLTHLPTILTIIFALYVVLNNQRTPYTTPALLGWVIALIALLATAMLTERVISIRKIEKNVEETNVFLKLREGSPSLDNILKTRQSLPPLEERLKFSKDIKITGGSLTRLSSEYLGFFEERAKEGCNFHFLLLDPASLAAKLIAENVVYEVDNYDAYKSHIGNALVNLKALKNKFPNKIHIKITDIVPSYSLLICDSDRPIGNMMVELYPYRIPTRQRPHMMILKNREPDWFAFFNTQFDLLWKSQRNIEITADAE